MAWLFLLLLQDGWDERLKALPKTFAERRFRFLLYNQEIGQAVLKTVEKDGVFVLDDTLKIEGVRRKHLTALVQTCAPDRTLSPKKIVSTGTVEFTAELKDGALVSEDKSVEISKKTVTTFALFRVVSILPQQKGFAFEFDSLEAEELNFKPGHALTCIGEEEVTIDGKAVRAWAWEHSGRGIIPAKYWVKDHLLLRAVVNNRTEWVAAEK